jgi:hypothetical protein
MGAAGAAASWSTAARSRKEAPTSLRPAGVPAQAGPLLARSQYFTGLADEDADVSRLVSHLVGGRPAGADSRGANETNVSGPKAASCGFRDVGRPLISIPRINYGRYGSASRFAVQVNAPELTASCPMPFDEGRLWKGRSGSGEAHDLRRSLERTGHVQTVCWPA